MSITAKHIKLPQTKTAGIGSFFAKLKGGAKTAPGALPPLKPPSVGLSGKAKAGIGATTVAGLGGGGLLAANQMGAPAEAGVIEQGVDAAKDGWDTMVDYAKDVDPADVALGAGGAAVGIGGAYLLHKLLSKNREKGEEVVDEDVQTAY